MGARVLVVDDDEDLRALLVRRLNDGGYETAEAGDAGAARKALAENSFDLMLCDINMPGESGLTLSRDLLMRGGGLRVVMMSAMYSPSLGRTVDDLGASGFLVKPVSKQDLLSAVEAALGR